MVAPIVDGIDHPVFGRCARCCPSREWPKPRHDRVGRSWYDAIARFAGTGMPLADLQAAPSIVTEAVSVLDEEMARGVLAARDAQGPQGRRTDAGSVLRQLHDALDSLARLFPELQGMPESDDGHAGRGVATTPRCRTSSRRRRCSGQRGRYR